MNTLNPQTLQWLLPHLALWSLVFCGLLWLIHWGRLYRRSSFCWPKDLQYKVHCSDVSESRNVIRHENDLMNHRLMWLMTAEGLLFTALGFALSKDNTTIAEQLIPILSFVGILLGASASIVLDAADAAIIRWSPPQKKQDDKGDVIGYRGLPLIGLLAPWRIYPPMFIIAWYIISKMNVTR